MKPIEFAIVGMEMKSLTDERPMVKLNLKSEGGKDSYNHTAWVYVDAEDAKDFHFGDILVLWPPATAKMREIAMAPYEEAACTQEG